MKNSYGFVLIQPQLGENIGASARSLKNFGFNNLIITNPKCSWPNIKAKATSVGAFDIIDKTKVFKNTNSAIKNFDLIDSKNKKKYLILGDMLELGKHSKKLHIDLSDMINSSGINNVSVYGNDIKETYKKINYKKKGLILREKSQIIDLIKNNLTNNDYLMIKGSNSTGLNKITSYLKGIK